MLSGLAVQDHRAVRKCDVKAAESWIGALSSPMQISWIPASSDVERDRSQFPLSAPGVDALSVRTETGFPIEMDEKEGRYALSNGEEDTGAIGL